MSELNFILHDIERVLRILEEEILGGTLFLCCSKFSKKIWWGKNISAESYIKLQCSKCRKEVSSTPQIIFSMDDMVKAFLEIKGKWNQVVPTFKDEIKS